MCSGLSRVAASRSTSSLPTLDNIDTIPDLIFEHNLLKPDGILVVEHGKANNFVCHPRYLEHRVYGSVNFSIFR